MSHLLAQELSPVWAAVVADPGDPRDGAPRHLQDGLATGHAAAADVHLRVLGRAARRSRGLRARQVLPPAVPRAQRLPPAQSAAPACAAPAASAAHRLSSRRTRQRGKRQRKLQCERGPEAILVLVVLWVQTAVHHAAHELTSLIYSSSFPSFCTELTF